MEGQDNAKFIDFQASTKYFFDSAAQCFTHCVKDFNDKELNASERTCVNECFTKQMVVYGSLVNNQPQTQK